MVKLAFSGEQRRAISTSAFTEVAVGRLAFRGDPEP